MIGRVRSLEHPATLPMPADLSRRQGRCPRQYSPQARTASSSCRRSPSAGIVRRPASCREPADGAVRLLRRLHDRLAGHPGSSGDGRHRRQRRDRLVDELVGLAPGGVLLDERRTTSGLCAGPSVSSTEPEAGHGRRRPSTAPRPAPALAGARSVRRTGCSRPTRRARSCRRSPASRGRRETPASSGSGGSTGR